MAKILSIGQAVYREANSIQISEPDDWGWFYRSEDGDMLVIQVHKNIWGKWVRTIPYHVLPNPQIDVTDLKVEHRNDLPYSVKARIVSKDRNNKKAKSAPVLFKRISLDRFSHLESKESVENAYLEPESGYRPTLFFFMLGGTGSGKTCWLTALSTGTIQDKIFSQRHIHYFDQSPETIVAPDGTKPETIIFHPFFLSKKRNKKDMRAVVFIVDISGEIGNYKRRDPQFEILRDSIGELASGLFVVRSEKWLLGQKIIQNDPSEFIILDLLQRDNDLDEDKFCYILTCADKIKDMLEKGEDIRLDLAPDSPIFTQTDCTAKQMYENMAIASDLMKRRDGTIGNSPCFAVSCCSNTGKKDDKTGREFLDFDAAYNADLPIVYMLQRLVKTR